MIYTQRESLTSRRSKIPILFKCTWNIFKDRPRDSWQNTPPQIQENWSHNTHFLWPQGPESRNQPQGKNSKPLKLMQIEEHAIKQWMGQAWYQGGNQKVHGNKWKWTCNDPKLMGHSKDSPEREVYSNTDISKKEAFPINSLSLLPKEREEKQQRQPRENRRQEITKTRAQWNNIQTESTIQRSMNPGSGALKRQARPISL